MMAPAATSIAMSPAFDIGVSPSIGRTSALSGGGLIEIKARGKG
jgi:hypothetical protein